MSLLEMLATTDEKKMQSDEIDELLTAYDNDCDGQNTEMREYLYHMLPAKVKRALRRRDLKG